MYTSDNFRKLFPFLFKEPDGVDVIQDDHTQLICHHETDGVKVLCDQRQSEGYETDIVDPEKSVFSRKVVVGFRDPKCDSCAACSTVLGYKPIIERNVVIVESQIEEPSII